MSVFPKKKNRNKKLHQERAVGKVRNFHQSPALWEHVHEDCLFFITAFCSDKRPRAGFDDPIAGGKQGNEE